MKKIAYFLALSLAFVMPLSAAKNKTVEMRPAEAVFEGYDSFAWGTHAKDIKDKYGTAVNTTKESDKANNVVVYTYTKNEEFKREFRFYDDKLYQGITTYSNVTHDLLIAIMGKLEKTYGTKNKAQKNNQGAVQTELYIWNITDTYRLEVTVRRNINQSSGVLQDTSVIIDMRNPILEKQKNDHRMKKMTQDIEL